jgi:hypothetical protein
MGLFESVSGSGSRPISSRSFTSFGTNERMVSSGWELGIQVPAMEGVNAPVACDGIVPEIVDISELVADGVEMVESCP